MTTTKNSSKNDPLKDEDVMELVERAKVDYERYIELVEIATRNALEPMAPREPVHDWSRPLGLALK
jgi:hypothetical protein